MDLVYIGTIVNTHGIKGEMKVLSEFKYKKEVFKIGSKIIVGRFKEVLKIKSYRVHKNFDMITFNEINNINDVLQYKGEKVFVDRKNISKDIVLNEDLIDFEVVYKKAVIGELKEIINNSAHDIFVIKGDKKKHLIPYVDEFIEEIDYDKKQIFIKEMNGLIDED